MDPKCLSNSELLNVARSIRADERRLERKLLEHVAEKIEDGSLSLSSIAKVQSAIRKEERRTGKKISIEVQAGLIEQSENKTLRQTEQVLAEQFPALKIPKDYPDRSDPLRREIKPRKSVLDSSTYGEVGLRQAGRASAAHRFERTRSHLEKAKYRS